MNPTHRLMLQLLETGTPAEKRHAAARIAIGFAPDPSPPPITTQLLNVGAAAARVVTASLTGQPVYASEEIAAARLAVCEPCDQRLGDGRCAGCGCWIKAKASLATEDCPLGKWPEAGD